MDGCLHCAQMDLWIGFHFSIVDPFTLILNLHWSLNIYKKMLIQLLSCAFLKTACRKIKPRIIPPFLLLFFFIGANVSVFCMAGGTNMSGNKKTFPLICPRAMPDGSSSSPPSGRNVPNDGGENGKLMSPRCCHNTRWSSGLDRGDRGFQPQVLPIAVQLLLITEERRCAKCYTNSGSEGEERGRCWRLLRG